MSVDGKSLERNGKLAKRVEYEVRSAGFIDDVAPRAAPDKDGTQTGLGRGAKVVVEAIADVGDLMGLMAADGDEFAEKRHVGFGDAPVIGGGQDIAREVEFAQEMPGAGGLVTGDTHEVPGVFKRLEQGRTSG